MDIILNNNHVEWDVGDVLKTPDDHVYLICYNKYASSYSLCELKTGCCVGDYETLDELISNNITEWDVNVNATLQVGGM